MSERIPAWLKKFCLPIFGAFIVGLGGFIWSAHADIATLKVRQDSAEKVTQSIEGRLDRIQSGVQKLIDLHVKP